MSIKTALGLMSGTSADGIDAAILVTDGESQLEVKGGITVPYDPEFQESLLLLAQAKSDEATITRTAEQLTRLHANAVEQCCQQAGMRLAQIDVIGFHGHTIRHQPEQGITRQIGDGPLLAQLTGRQVVYDFRTADVDAGGQGAPLAPLYHRAVLGDRPGTHVVLNLGGVGNITWISGDQIIAGDTGPGCGLLDLWVTTRTDLPFDEDGRIALAGKVNSALVAKSLESIPYFQEPFPKSADRFDFASIDVSELSLEDGAATLCALTVAAVAQAARRLPVPADDCWVTGGGSHHPLMMRLLANHFPHVAAISELGHREDMIEAECFAWLAVRKLKGLPTSLPATTGASAPIVGGVVA